MSGGRLALGLSALAALAVLAPLLVLALLAVGAEFRFDARSVEIIVNSIALAGLTVVGATVIGVPIALVTSHANLRFRRLWLVLLAAPLAIPSYIGAFTWFAAFGAGGEIEQLTGLATPDARGLLGAAAVMTLYTYPFVLLTTRAALARLDGTQVDAARCLGLSLHRAIVRIVLPGVRAGVAAGALLVALYALSDFATPAILGVDTFTRMIYIEYNAFGLDRAALLSLQLLVLVGLVLWLESRVGIERAAPGRRLEIALGHRLKGLMLVFMCFVLALAVLLPALVFGLWLVRDGVGSFRPGPDLELGLAVGAGRAVRGAGCHAGCVCGRAWRQRPAAGTHCLARFRYPRDRAGHRPGLYRAAPGLSLPDPGSAGCRLCAALSAAGHR